VKADIEQGALDKLALRVRGLAGLFPDEFFHTERPAFARIERAHAFVEFVTKPPQRLHVGQPPPDLLMVGIRKICDLCDRLYEYLRRHDDDIAHRLIGAMSRLGQYLDET
jgi:hypothetical protein